MPLNLCEKQWGKELHYLIADVCTVVEQCFKFLGVMLTWRPHCSWREARSSFLQLLAEDIGHYTPTLHIESEPPERERATI